MKKILMLAWITACTTKQADVETPHEKEPSASVVLKEDVDVKIFQDYEGKEVPSPKVKKKEIKKVEIKKTAVIQSPEGKKDFSNKCLTSIPYKIGEKITWDVSYFLVNAGSATLSVQPLTELKGNKSIHMKVEATTGSSFSSLVYRLSDQVHSFMDYEKMISYKQEIIRDESRLKGRRIEIFDHDKGESYFWETRDHIEKGKSEKKFTSKLDRGSLDPMAVFYFSRCLDIHKLGAEYYVPIHTEGKNRLAWLKVDRKEELNTDIGKFSTTVVKAKMILNGVLQARDAFEVWFSEDEKKIPLQMRIKVKIGSVYAEITKYEEGHSSL